MAELSTLARPYAKAAFEHARDHQAIAAWSEALGVAAQVAEQPKVREFLSEPGRSAAELADGVVALLGDKVTPAVANFIHVLAEQKRLRLLPFVAVLFAAMKEAYERSVDVEVTSAFPLSSEVEAKLAQSLAARLNREVRLQSSVDSSLIGGVVIRAGDTVIDASMRRRLAKLAEAIQS